MTSYSGDFIEEDIILDATKGEEIIKGKKGNEENNNNDNGEGSEEEPDESIYESSGAVFSSLISVKQ